MTEEEIAEANARFGREAHEINQADPGQGYPCFDHGNEFEDPDEAADRKERIIQWEFWREDMDDVSGRTLRLLRSHLVQGGIYNVQLIRPTYGLSDDTLSVVTYIGEEDWQDESEWNDLGVWCTTLRFLMRDGRTLRIAWTDPEYAATQSAEVFMHLYDQDDYIFMGLPHFERIS